MQPDQLFSFLAMLWASGSALPEELCAANARLADREVFAALYTELPEGTIQVSTESELTAALQNPTITTIILATDIIVMSDIIINRQGQITLDLNSYKIASLKANASAIDLQAGNLNLTGKGSIVANGLSSSGIRIKGAMTAENANYASLTLGSEVTLYAPHAYGVYLMANFNAAYGVEITIQGKIIARHGIGIHRLVKGLGKHAPQINIADTALIEVDADEGIALSAAGYGIWQIGAATLTGATGASVKSGQITFTRTKIVATGELANPSGWDNTIGVGAVVQVEENSDYAGKIQLNFNDGEYTSRQSYLVAKYGTAATLQKLSLTAGKFQVTSGVFYGVPADTNVTVSGGVFSTQNTTELSDYLPQGYYLETNPANGTVAVIDPNPPAAEIDPAEQLALECTALENLIARAKKFLDKSYVGNELGEWQDVSNKAVAAIRRAVKAAEKLLQTPKTATLDQVLHLQKRIKSTIRNLEKVSDDLRGEMLSVLSTAQELDPHDYSAYSYQALSEAMTAALTLTAQPEVSLNQLYSVFCDLQLNIDLLDDPEDELDIALPTPPTIPPGLPAPVISLSEPILEPQLDLVDPEPQPAELQQFAELGAAVILETLNQPLPELETPESVATPEESESLLTTSDVIDAPASQPEEPVDELALSALADARTSLYLMLDAVHDLALKDYQAEYAEQFGELQVAIVKAQAVLQKPDAVLPEILDAMDEVKFATAGLQLDETPAPAPQPQPQPQSVVATPSAKNHTRLGTIALAAMSKSTHPTSTTDWSALREVVADIAKLQAEDYTATTYNNVLANLERAKMLLANPAATQSDVDDLVFELNLSLLALERNVQAPVSQQFIPKSPTEPTLDQAAVFADQSVTPNLLMSMMAGAYAGLATYRKSRLAAKKRKTARKIQLFSKA